MKSNIEKIIISINIILEIMGKEKNTSSNQNTIKSLEDNYNFKLKSKKIDVLINTPLLQPVIFFDEKNEPFILLKSNQQEFLIFSIERKETEILTKEDFIKICTGAIYHLEFKNKSYFNISWFFPVFMKYKKTFYSILFYAFTLQLLALSSPLVIQVIMDKVIIHKALSTLDVLIIGLIFIAISEGVLKGIREYIYQHTANKIDILLSLKLTTHLFKLPLSYFKSRPTGTIVSRVKELDIIRDFITNILLMALVDFSFMFIFIGVMAILSLKLTIIFLLTIPLYFIFAKLLSPKIEKNVQELYEKSASNVSFLTESLGGIETIKSLSLEPRFTQQWHEQIHQLTNKGLKLQNIDNFSHYIISILHKITVATILWLGAYEVISLSMTIGQLIAFNMLLSQCLQPLGKSIDIWGKYIRTKAAIYNLQDILNLPQEQEKATVKNKLKGEITFNQVNFYYKDKTAPILNDLSIHIKPNEIIGIVGTSGSGKSTLAKMIAGLYTPQTGLITLDGIPISQINPISLRQQVGYILQDNYLFHLSVFNNIRLSVPDASLDQVISVAKLAGAHDFILKLPLGYDTMITEGGTSLSGGQRQRIAIARALLPEPKILIFDEATSALDDESQTIIQRHLPYIARNKTVIIIAHRLSTTKICNRILFLEKGHIVEQGSHETLIKKEGHYKKLLAFQQGNK
ncbi:peptidase domain-containing ABC transporter [Proteus faecis]|uniref:peptidase domain-containing ABC transporter n=1 Tax=Proteus faecis TaxID=2050967 RepID=UPI003075BD60